MTAITQQQGIHIDGGDLDRPENDFNMLLGTILSFDNPSESTLSVLCSQLHSLIPTLDLDEISRLEKLLKKLFGFLSVEQQTLLTHQLSTWHLHHSRARDAMHYLSYSLKHSLSETHHASATEVILQWIIDNKLLQKRLATAYDLGEIEFFDHMLETIDQLGPYCTFEQFQALKKQANDVLVADIKENRIALFTPSARKLHTLTYPGTSAQLTPPYYVALEEYRKHCTLENFRVLFNVLVIDALLILGRPPCHFDIRAMGSLSRNEPGPYSDLEAFFLIEDSKHLEYFQHLAQLIELQFISLGETDFPHLEIQQGMHIDPGANPARHLDLIGTPEEMVARTAPNNSEELRLTLFQSVSLYATSADLEGAFHKGLDPQELKNKAQTACAALKEHYEVEWAINPEQLREFNLKEQFILPLNVFLGLLKLYHGENVQKFTPATQTLIAETRHALQKIRIKAQLRSQSDVVSSQLLEQDELETLFRAYWLLIRPLYQSFDRLFETLTLDLPKEALNNALKESINTPFLNLIKYFALHLIDRRASRDEFELNYRKLLEQPALRRIFLETLESRRFNIDVLAHIHARDGYCYAQTQDARYVDQALMHFTIETPSNVVVVAPHLGKRYLRPEVERILIDNHGNLNKLLNDCFHNVSKATLAPFTLYFKQKPNNPLMEYAIHSLSYRVAGKSTPPSQLVRFEVNGRAYPVLVSQAIEGETLKHNLQPKTDRASFTKMLLWAILTRPGDGRASNYILNGLGRIFCVDNDVSFVEPVTSTRMSQQINFSSILFTMDNAMLEEEVLRDFVQCNPDAILYSWMEDVIEKEQEYLALFSLEERTRLYEEDPENRFTPSLMFKEGAIATLYLQFHHLQQFVEKARYRLVANDLLKALITLSNEGGKREIGDYISKRYAIGAGKLTSERRLEKALAKSQAKSMSSSEAMGAIFSKVPTIEDIERKKTYNLEKAKEELYALVLDEVLDGTSIVSRRGRSVIHASFEKVEPHRHKVVLEAVLALVKTGRVKAPTEIDLSHCQALTNKTLKPFLNKDLKVLNLRNCTGLTSAVGEQIATNCPNLEELYLSGTQIEAFPKQPIRGSKTLDMQNLKELHISRCEKLKSIRLYAPSLQVLKTKQCPKLDLDKVEVPLRAIPGVTVFDESDWKRYFDLSRFDLSFDDAPPLDFESIASQLRTFQEKLSIEDDAGITFLALPRGLSFNKLVELANAPCSGEGVKFKSVDNKFREKYGDDVLGSSMRVMITDNVLKDTRNETILDNMILIRSLGCRLPRPLETAALCITRFIAKQERLYSDSPLCTFTYCYEKVGFKLDIEYEMCVGAFSRRGLEVNNVCDCGHGRFWGAGAVLEVL